MDYQNPATLVMEYIHWFSWYTLIIMALIVMLVVGLLGWCAWRFNERPIRCPRASPTTRRSRCCGPWCRC